MILVADSSALIALSIIDKLEILDTLYGQVIIPKSVYQEITRDNKLESQKLSLYCHNKVVKISTETNFNISLGLGESEAIVLYKEKNANYLLCDDKKAKKFAQNFNINVIGSLGVLLKAKEKSLIPKIQPLLTQLKSSKIYIDDNTCKLVLKIAGEL